MSVRRHARAIESGLAVFALLLGVRLIARGEVGVGACVLVAGAIFVLLALIEPARPKPYEPIMVRSTANGIWVEMSKRRMLYTTEVEQLRLALGEALAGPGTWTVTESSHDRLLPTTERLS